MTQQIAWHNQSFEEAVKKLSSDSEQGLTDEEVEIRRRKFGPNELPEEKTVSSVSIFLSQLKSPLIYILIAAGIITLILRDYNDAVVIFGAVFLNTVIGFLQERKSAKIFSELKKLVRTKAYVLRSGNEKETDQADLTRGDIFLLRPGNKTPADGRLISANGLKINESFLTGEWLAAEKKNEILPLKTVLADRDNMVYMGAVVEEGRGKAIAVGIGGETEMGRIAALTKEIKQEKTPFQKRMIELSGIIGVAVVFICFLIFIFGVAAGREPYEMFLTGVAVAVAAVPEGLPAAVTVILALGMRRILKRRGLVRKMAAAETLGSTSVIMTDKTGTLTEARMRVADIYSGHECFLNNGENHNREIGKNNSASHLLILKAAILSSEAFVENLEAPLEKWAVRGRPTEKAVLLAGIQAGINKKKAEKKEPLISQLSFDSNHKYSAVLRKLNEEENVFYILGAPEIILKMSKFSRDENREEILSEEKIGKLNKKCESLAINGKRVLAVAYRKVMNSESVGQNLTELAEELVFAGFISLHDPLRKGAKEAIEICRRSGIRTIIATGDHKLTARAIAVELGLPAEEENIITGEDLEKMSESELSEKLDKLEIYARLEPKQKTRIIRAWRKKGEVVAMTGDGVNDTPAIRRADIGIAPGSASDAAKEASDLILLNNDFSIIVAAIEEGRHILDNSRKVIAYLFSDIFAEIFLIGASIFAGLPLPILPTQILWVNLIEDTFPAVALSFEPKEKDIMSRALHRSQRAIFTGEMKFLIFAIGFLTNFFLLGLFFWLLSRNMNLAEIRTIIFACLAMTSLFYVFSCRNLRKNIWQYNPFSNLYLVFGVILGFLALAASVSFEPLRNILKTVPLSLSDWILIFGLGMINLFLVEIVKRHYKNKGVKK